MSKKRKSMMNVPMKGKPVDLKKLKRQTDADLKRAGKIKLT